MLFKQRGHSVHVFSCKKVGFMSGRAVIEIRVSTGFASDLLNNLYARLPHHGLKEVCRVAKKVIKVVKLQIPAGKANPAPPVGPALGQAGVNIMGFCKEFNARTQEDAGLIIPVEITVFEDRSFSFITKTPPAAVLLKKAAGIDSGSGEPNRNKVATLKRDKVKEIAETKMPDLNAADVEAAMRMVEGTARSMGIVIED